MKVKYKKAAMIKYIYRIILILSENIFALTKLTGGRMISSQTV